VRNLQDRLRAARGFANLSQQQLADRLGISIGTVKRRELGEAHLNNQALMATAQACEVPLSFLLEGWSDEQLNESMAEVLARVDQQDQPPVLPDPDSLPGD
jgi:transcriptional regulator with XRE-family HTH domain